MKKLLFLMVAIISITLSSCTKVEPNAGEEAVLIYKPWLFGHGGVDETPIKTGLTWCAPTTDYVMFKITPTRFDVQFDDIMSNDNTPLDYSTYLILQVKEGKSPILMRNYGKDWFNNNIEEKYKNYVREEISKYSPFDLMSNREVCATIDSHIKEKVNNYIKGLSSRKEFPVICREVITGRAKPNAQQLHEMNNTAAAIQAKVTQERRAEMEIVREKAERQRALADKAYMNQLNLSSHDLIMLKIIEKSNPNIDVVIGGNTSQMWNVRR